MGALCQSSKNKSETYMINADEKIKIRKIRIHVFKIWAQRLLEDEDVFDKGKFDPDNEHLFVVNKDNAFDFLEAINVEDFI